MYGTTNDTPSPRPSARPTSKTLTKQKPTSEGQYTMAVAIPALNPCTVTGGTSKF